MKRTLITLIAAGTLAVPAGLAFAQADTSEPTEPTPTCEEHEHSWDRVNQRDPAAEHGQHRAENRHQVGEATCDGDCTGEQVRQQLRLEDAAGDQVRDQVRLEDETGDRVQLGTPARLADDAGNGRRAANG